MTKYIKENKSKQLVKEAIQSVINKSSRLLTEMRIPKRRTNYLDLGELPRH